MTGKSRYRLAFLFLVIGLCVASMIAATPKITHAQDNTAQGKQAGSDTDADHEGDPSAGQDEGDADTTNTNQDEDDEKETHGYSVDIGPDDFVKVVDNPYFPLIPGTRWVYAASLADGGTERIVLEILNETRQIKGVTATILHDSVYKNGELVEDTHDWYAQDKQGNVWYLGEVVDNYEGGMLVDHEGSWEWGVDGALPGVNMWANPAKKRVKAYYQEFYAGVAEDMGLVLSASESITVPVGSFQAVVQTYDFSSLKPEIQGHKFYAPGIGIIKEVGLLTGEETVLVEYTPAGTPSSPPPELLPQPTSGFPPGIAPDSARVDMVKPHFTNSTMINNRFLPITQVDQIIQIGQKDGKPHRTELTLLPGTQTIAWNGERTETRLLQFVAYLDGRILETAIDRIAQADDGALWYFGEDVANYADGVIVDHEGTWLAGKDGPPAMIMPANPRVGNVYRVENIPTIAFEEVTVRAINQTLEGPRGLIPNAMFVTQIGMDGKTTVKAFAPGYGEFLAHTEDAAVALPIDTLATPLPEELKMLLHGATGILAAAAPEDWDAIAASLDTITAAWEAHQSTVDLGALFPLLDERMTDAIASLTTVVEQRNPDELRSAAFAVAVATLDLQMPYQPRATIDLARLDLWTRRLLVDNTAEATGAIKGDVTTLELVRDRIVHLLAATDRKTINTLLSALRSAADTEQRQSTATSAGQLLDFLAGLHLAGIKP